jgi:hypothetical protein
MYYRKKATTVDDDVLLASEVRRSTQIFAD